jgi:hypothetical protein
MIVMKESLQDNYNDNIFDHYFINEEFMEKV